MAGPWKMRWATPGDRFAHILKTLVNHLGLEAETELIELLGRARLKELYEGDEPRLGEFIEIARILEVPLSTFQIAEPGSIPELEIAFAEILYTSASLDPQRLALLADRMSDLATEFRKIEPNGPPLPESLRGALRKGEL